MKTPWSTSSKVRLANCPSHIRICLTETSSLTKRLSHYCDHELTLEVIGQNLAKPSRGESYLLNIPMERRAMVREVVIGCCGSDWMFARSIFPTATLQKRKHLLSRLNQIPLANILFSDRGISRIGMQIDKIHSDSINFTGLKNKNTYIEKHLWARTSIFTIEGSPFLVKEVFLPEFSTKKC